MTLSSNVAVTGATKTFNYLVATVEDGTDGMTGSTSDVVILEYDPSLQPEVLFRVNAGGALVAAIDDAIDWSGDQSTSPSPYLATSGSNTTGFTGGTVETSGPNAVPATTPPGVFDTERWDPPAAPEMLWSFPTGDGQFILRLYMKNGFSGTDGAGERIFDVSVEGVLAIDDLDLSGQHGHQVGVMYELPVTVSDGSLDVEFLHQVENPLINAIEILGSSGPVANVPPQVTNPGNQVHQVGDTPDLTIVASDADGPQNLAYSATGLPPGLGIESTNGHIFGTIADGAEANSPYTTTVTVSDGEDETSVSFSWTVLAEGSASVLYRVNNGGPELAAADGSSPAWSEDQAANDADAGGTAVAGTPSPYVNSSETDDTFGTSSTVTPNGSVPASVPAALFQMERWDDTAAPEMEWDFPVPAGATIEVRLYFAEVWSGAASPGVRVFDVEVEGAVPAVFDDIDPYVEAGNSVNVGFMLSHTLTVSDNNLDVNFLHGAQNPAVKGIEIINVGGTANAAPVIDPIDDVTATEGDPVVVNVSASDAENDPITLSIEVEDAANTPVDPAAYTFTDNGDGTALFDWQTQVGDAGSYTATVTAADGTSATTETFAITIDPEGQPTALFRINAGGPQYTDSESNVWEADAHHTGGSTHSNGTAIAGTDDDALYQTERYGNPFSYSFAVPNGSYDLQLHFAEIFHGVNSGGDCPVGGDCTGTRVFDVEVEGVLVLDDYDIYAAAGASAAAAVETLTDIAVNDGTLDVTFLLGPGGVDNAKVSALAVFPADTGEPTGNPSALVKVNPGAGLNASTFNDNAFQILNTGDVDITSVSIDVSTAYLPDIVFDPNGTAGDAGAKCLTPNNTVGTPGYVTPGDPCVDPFSQPHDADGDGTGDPEDGYDVVTLAFTDFNGGEQFNFSVDQDPNSIKNDSNTGDAGAISGFENIGATVTVVFANGQTLTANLWDEGSLGGSQAVVAPEPPTPAPTVSVQGILAPAVVNDASQTLLLTGPNDADFTVLQVDARLYIDDPNSGGGYDIDPFEANEAMAKVLYTDTFDGSGQASVPVTLLQTAGASGTPDGGLNHFIAVVNGTGEQTSATSNVIVLEYDPDASGGDPLALIEVNANTSIEGSTFSNGSFVIANNSTGAIEIESVALDLSTAVFMDVVFDPSGDAGDTVGKCLQVNSGAAATGFVTPGDACVDPFSEPHDGDGNGTTLEGFDVMELAFTDFGPGETLTFSVDIDPTSIKGDTDGGDAGAISGLELAGSKVTVTLTDGITQYVVVTDLFSDGSGGGSQAIVKEVLAPAPALAVDGVTLTSIGTGRSAAMVADLSQTLTISGTPNADVQLLHVDARLYIEDSTPDADDPPDGEPGFDLDVFEANQALAVDLIDTITLDGSGQASVPVTLLQTASSDAGPDGGINHFLAVEVDADGHAGLTSDVIVLEYNPDGSTAVLSGTVTYYNGTTLEGATLQLRDDAEAPVTDATSAADGTFSLSATTGAGYTLEAAMPDDEPASQGVSTLDIALARRDILNIQALDSPYKKVAGDVNATASLSTLDLTLMRQLVLGLRQDFADVDPEATSGSARWRCIATGSFSDPQDPFSFDEARAYTPLLASQTGQDFTCFRRGDVDGSWTPAPQSLAKTGEPAGGAAPSGTAETTSASEVQMLGAPITLFAKIQEQPAAATELVIPVHARGFDDIGGVQFTLAWDPGVLRYTGVEPYGLEGLSPAHYSAERTADGLLAFAWDHPEGEAQSLSEERALFAVRFSVIDPRAAQQVHLGFTSALTQVQAHRVLGEGANAVLGPVYVETQDLEQALLALPETFALQGNYPNPFNPSTTVRFDLPEAARVTVDVYDMLGRRVLHLDAGTLPPGAGQQLVLEGSRLASGSYIYRLHAEMESGHRVATGRMTLLK